LHWIEQYYKDIPILQARLKYLTNHNEFLIKENHDLKENEQRHAKHLKKIGNIVIMNAGSVKDIINFEIS
jgi:cell division protein FtsB